MSSQRTERLLNLVIALLWTRTWLSKEQIRQAVPQYSTQKSSDAFERMFERDKDDLRELGIPVLTGSSESYFDDDTTTMGYKIDREAYELPPLNFTQAEATVLGLASRVWQQASLAGPAARALTKLKALGVEADQESLIGVEPRVRTSEPAFAPLYRAVISKTVVTFSYRKPGGQSAPTLRRLQPWGLLTWHGRWYVSGYDLDRDAARVFRLSRIEGNVKSDSKPGAYTIPDDFDARAVLASRSSDVVEQTAKLQLAPGTAHSLRMRAERGVEEPNNWDGDEISIRFTDTRSFAAELASYGPDVYVLTPESLRQAVINHLQRFLEEAE
ncbi:WYL domain-containing protein [Saxibacter everestensis]|uniref:WYL domain-containing protein n=1 Tax=Saxibacter everestensis TaxID=2909229 RepID=A0ABY8QZL6_9MICO|nr:WYL domain-containing protein [Brevibacteriaceae bacterium ZFBP1038]